MGPNDGDAQVLGDHVLLEVIGSGPHGTVHRARRRDRTGGIVAVKRLHVPVTEEAVARLRRDAATLAALAHPVIAPILDVAVGPDGGVALVSPYSPGGSLQDVLDRQGGLPWPQVADLGARLASGLAAAHDAGVVHGAVAPSNVLLDAGDEPRLTDFGSSVLRADQGDGGLAPNDAVARANSPLGDVQDLGTVLDRALSDRGDVPAELAAVVERARAADPADRYASARAMHEALAPLAPADGPPRPGAAASLIPGADDHADTRVLGRGPAPAGGSRSRWARWRRVGGRPEVIGVAVAGLAVVALLVGASLWAFGRDADGPSPAAAPSSPDPVGLRPRVPEPRCPGVEDPAGEAVALEADVDDRGCTLPLVVTEEPVDGEPTLVLRVPADAGALAGRYAIGAMGDRVLVGDWDCDGTDTPAVVRDDSGEVFHFDGYGELQPRRGPTLAAGAEPVVMTDHDGCDHVIEAAG